MIGQTVAEVSGGPAVTMHSSRSSALGWIVEALLTSALSIVAILSSFHGNPERAHQQKAVTVAPSSVLVTKQPVTKSALTASPKAAPRLPSAPRDAVLEMAGGDAEAQTTQNSPIILEPGISEAPVAQDTKLGDGNATETPQKKSIARVTGALKHLNPLGRKKTPVVRTTTPE